VLTKLDIYVFSMRNKEGTLKEK